MKISNLIKRLKAGRPKEPDFDWSSIPRIDPEELDRWFGATDARDRTFPLQVALQVHDELETKLMSEGKMDALALAEVRGALKALSRFSKLYLQILKAKKPKQEDSFDA